MAEHVQASLDAMVGPLLDLQERQIFTSEEIRAIVARRRASEYQLRRRSPRKADFVAYLQQEMNLEQLRQLRTTRQRREELQNRQRRQRNDDDDDNQRQSKHLGDRHIMQHILLLWTRTMRKYRDDLSLWLTYIGFLKSTHKYRQLSAVYGEALRFHPRATGLWIEASSFEYFDRSNVEAARVLLQRGLRLNPNSRELWHQAFVLEMHVVQKLHGRQMILKPEANDEGDETEGAKETDTNKKDPYALARIVMEHAAQELKSVNDVQSLWLECLESCQSFPSKSTHALQRDLLNKLKTSSSSSGGPKSAVISWMAEAAWVRNHPHLARPDPPQLSSLVEEEEGKPSRRAKRPRVVANEETKKYRDPVLQVLREATHAIRNEDMYRESIQFLTRHIRHLEEDEEVDIDGDEQNEDGKDADALREAWSLLHALWAEVRESDFFTAPMVLEYVDYLLENAEDDEEENDGDDKGQVVEAAIQVLQNYIDENSTKLVGGIPASLWVRLARLQSDQGQSSSTAEDAAATLRRGIAHTPPYQRYHLLLLVNLMSELLETMAPSSERSKELWSLLDRILLAYPSGTLGGGISTDDITTVPEVCLAFQRCVADHEGLDGSRRLYEKLLFQSGFAERILQDDIGAHFLEQIVDQAVEAESKCVLWKDRQLNLLRIIDFAVRNVPSKAAREKYRKARDEIQYGTAPRIDQQLFSTSQLQPTIPSFDVSSIEGGPQLLRKAYDVNQVVHLRNVPFQTQSVPPLTWKDLDALYQNLGVEDQKSWCVETGGQDVVSPQQFLKDEYSTVHAYCSFLVQKDKEALDSLVAKLPSPPANLLGWEDSSTSHEPAVWVFFGRNAKGSAELDGRPEHTDSVSHDGTWHVQISGRKRWTLRPSCLMLQHLRQYLPHRAMKQWTEDTRMEIECTERDVLVINTRLWFHQTSIPVQQKPSVSLARDFRFASDEAEVPAAAGTMSNVDGLYARNHIDEGTIIFAEDDLPDAELHVSSKDPNCRVVELDDGSRAVVASRPIASGEFFCVPPSDDYDEEEEEEEAEEDDDENDESEDGDDRGDNASSD